MIEVWRGNANAWECDELGHMNVKFYLAKAMQGLANLAEQAGLGGIHRKDAIATLIPQTLHIKFLAESRPGAPLCIEGGISDIKEMSADIVLIMKHAGTNKIAASFRINLAHSAPNGINAHPWPQRFLDTADAFQVQAPEAALPRGIVEDEPNPDASLDQADHLGLETIGMGRFVPGDMDVFGRLSAETLLGRVSDSVVNFIGAFPEEWAFHKGEVTAGNVGSALLETRIMPRRWPQAGDGYVIRSGVKSFGPKVRNIVHWVLDPTTGKPWWTMEGVAAPMDLDARKLVEPSDEIRAKLADAVKPGIQA